MKLISTFKSALSILAITILVFILGFFILGPIVTNGKFDLNTIRSLINGLSAETLGLLAIPFIFLFFIVKLFIYKPLIRRLGLEILSADIRLEKDRYSGGELVKGVLDIEVKKKFRIRELKFSVLGKEETHILKQGSSGMYATYISRTKFFENDLSYLLKAVTTHRLHDGKLEVQPGRWTIDFELVISKVLHDSYKGKFASIAYEMNFFVNRPRRRNLTYRRSFTLLNSTKEEPLLWTEKTSSKQMEPLRIRLENDNGTFLPGGVIKGTLILLEGRQWGKIRNAEITLNGIEYAIAGAKKKGKWYTKAKSTYATTTLETYKTTVEWSNVNSTQFMLPIPSVARKCYIGMYSNYYWLLQAKVNVAGNRDIQTAIYFGKSTEDYLQARGYSKAVTPLIWFINHPTIIAASIIITCSLVLLHTSTGIIAMQIKHLLPWL
jgi:hypothetical protein